MLIFSLGDVVGFAGEAGEVEVGFELIDAVAAGEEDGVSEVEAADDVSGGLAGDEGAEVGDEVGAAVGVPHVEGSGGAGGEDDVVEEAAGGAVGLEARDGGEGEAALTGARNATMDADTNGHGQR